MTLYSKENYPKCEIVKNYIKDNNITVEIDNTCNREVAMEHGIMQFPYLVFNDEQGNNQAIAGVENIQAILSTLIKPKAPEYFWRN